MAEIGLVASVVQIADTGIKLSITLYTFAETVLTADKSIREIASDVSLTSSVLEELGQNLKKDQKSRLCSENAVKTAEGIVKECAAIFNEINGTLETTLEKIKPRTGSEKANGRDGAHGGRKLAVAAYERLKWPFLQPKMQLLRSNLDRLKSTLVLMLNVITYARKVSEDHATPSTLEDQRKLIEDLARSNQEYTRKFKELTKAIEAGQDHLEAVKPNPAMENVPSSGFFQANMVLPPSESVHVAVETSPDITSRLTTLAKQHLPPDAGGQSDELAHYCLLIDHLLQRIDAVQYKIKSDLRRRIRSDVVHMHQREADQLKDVHGHRHFTTIMGSAILWTEILHPTESGASQTLRDLIHPDWSERESKDLNALLECGDGLHTLCLPLENQTLTFIVDPTHPSSLTTSISGLKRREELIQHEKRVARMIALEQLMRAAATGQEGISEDMDGASYRTGRMKESGTLIDVPSYKLGEQGAVSALMGLRKAEAGGHIEARQSSSQKSDHIGDGVLLQPICFQRRSSSRREADDLTTGTITSKITLPDPSRPTTASPRSSAGSKLHETEPLKQRYTTGLEIPCEETFSQPTGNSLDQERARVKKALDDRRDKSLSMMIFSEAEGNGEGSGVLLAGDLRILEALTSIRDKILEVAYPQRNMFTRSRPTGSASEIAEDAILTARILWRSVRLIHKNAHDRLLRADRDLAVARLVGLVLESAPVKVKAWKGLTDIDRTIDRILDGRETRNEAIARREILRKASKKFALLTSSQRQALREAWSPEIKYKENFTHEWKQVERLSRSITSLPTPKRREAQKTVVEQHPMSMPQPAEYSTIFELPAGSESNLRVQHNAPERTLSAEARFDIAPRVLNDEPKDQQNELLSKELMVLEKVEQLYLDSAHGTRSEEANYERERSIGMVHYTGGEKRYSEDLSGLDSWAGESTASPPEPRHEAEDAEHEHKIYADDMWDSDDYIKSGPYAREGTDFNPRGIMPPITRPRTPDIVDDLLAQWTTLPR